MVGCGAIDFRYFQRASGGTQKILTARYSSGSSGSAPFAFCASSSACLASKASEMYLRKIRPRTTCLYSAASMLLRRPSAICQSLASKPPLAAVVSRRAVVPLAMGPLLSAALPLVRVAPGLSQLRVPAYPAVMAAEGRARGASSAPHRVVTAGSAGAGGPYLFSYALVDAVSYTHLPLPT